MATIKSYLTKVVGFFFLSLLLLIITVIAYDGNLVVGPLLFLSAFFAILVATAVQLFQAAVHQFWDNYDEHGNVYLALVTATLAFALFVLLMFAK